MENRRTILKELAKIEEKVTVEVNELEQKYIDGIKLLKNVDEVTYDSNILLSTYKKGKNNLVELIDYLKKESIKYNKIYSERPTLNDALLCYHVAVESGYDGFHLLG